MMNFLDLFRIINSGFFTSELWRFKSLHVVCDVAETNWPLDQRQTSKRFSELCMPKVSGKNLVGHSCPLSQPKLACVRWAMQVGWAFSEPPVSFQTKLFAQLSVEWPLKKLYTVYECTYILIQIHVSRIDRTSCEVDFGLWVVWTWQKKSHGISLE